MGSRGMFSQGYRDRPQAASKSAGTASGATSLAQLWQQQGKQQRARKLLADIHGWFTDSTLSMPAARNAARESKFSG
jgi:hypothetical protein